MISLRKVVRPGGNYLLTGLASFLMGARSIKEGPYSFCYKGITDGFFFIKDTAVLG